MARFTESMLLPINNETANMFHDLRPKAALQPDDNVQPGEQDISRVWSK